MYPHSITGVLSTRSRSVIRRNASLLPAYSFLLGLLALLGFVAIAAGVKVANPQQSVPQLFENEFPPWFAGVAFAAIVIGALVPAAIMSIAAANLWTRNIYRAYINRDATHKQEAQQAKLVSLLVKFGALVFVLALSKDFAINLQLLGGVWILQTLPAIVVGLYTRWFHRWALLAGWAAGMALGHLAGLRRRVAHPGPLRWAAGGVPGHRDHRSTSPSSPSPSTSWSRSCSRSSCARPVSPPGTDPTGRADYTADLGDEGVEAELAGGRPRADRWVRERWMKAGSRGTARGTRPRNAGAEELIDPVARSEEGSSGKAQS